MEDVFESIVVRWFVRLVICITDKDLRYKLDVFVVQSRWTPHEKSFVERGVADTQWKARKVTSGNMTCTKQKAGYNNRVKQSKHFACSYHGICNIEKELLHGQTEKT